MHSCFFHEKSLPADTREDFFYLILHEKGMFYPLMAKSEPILPPFPDVVVRQTVVRDRRVGARCVSTDNYDQKLLQVNCIQLDVDG